MENIALTMLKEIKPPAARIAAMRQPARTLLRERPLSWILLLVCAVATGWPLSLVGQATAFGVLNGTVTDPAGRVMAKAHVEAKNVGTNEIFAVDTNSSGQFRIFNLLPAQYTLSFTAPGFQTLSLASFKLDVGESLTQNAQLMVGSESQVVQVAAVGQLLETTTVGKHNDGATADAQRSAAERSQLHLAHPADPRR